MGRVLAMSTLTREMVWSAATDAGNRHMRQAGRKRWSREDFEAATSEYERLARVAGLDTVEHRHETEN
jgi:hypothetical protein